MQCLSSNREPEARLVAKPPGVWFFADGGSDKGYGHWIRASRLGKKISNWASITYVIPGRGRDLESLPAMPGGIILRQQQALERLSFCAPQCLVTDLPEICPQSTRFIKRCRAAGAAVVSIHDLGLGKFQSDMAVDPSVSILKPFSPEKYPRGFYNGPAYVVLTEEFRFWHEQSKRYPENAVSLVITLGGGWTQPLLEHLWPAIESLAANMKISITAGFTLAAQKFTKGMSTTRIRYLNVPDTQNLARLLFEADLAVVAGGVSLYEAACVGTPAIVVSHNTLQEIVGRHFEQMGIACNLGVGSHVDLGLFETRVRELAADSSRRQRMGQRGRQCVDGLGAERVERLLQQIVCPAGCLERSL